MGKFVRNFLGSFLLLRALCMDLWTESGVEKTQQLHAAEESMLGTSTPTVELARARLDSFVVRSRGLLPRLKVGKAISGKLAR